MFDLQLRTTLATIEEMRTAGKLQEKRADDMEPWPEEASLILEEDTALVLGGPGVGSLSMMAWTDKLPIDDELISIVGPDLGELPEGKHPFGRLLLIQAEHDDPYECYREIMDAVYDTELEGFMVRTLPGKQSLWCRVGKEATADGFSLFHLGEALIENLKELDFIQKVQVLFITEGTQTLQRFEKSQNEVRRILEAIMKITEELEHDCDECDLQDICENIDEVKKIRRQMRRRKSEVNP